MWDFGTLLGQLSWLCADSSPPLPGDMLTHSAAWQSRAEPFRLSAATLGPTFFIHLGHCTVTVQRCSSYLLPAMQCPSGTATRAFPPCLNT